MGYTSQGVKVVHSSLKLSVIFLVTHHMLGVESVISPEIPKVQKSSPFALESGRLRGHISSRSNLFNLWLAVQQLSTKPFCFHRLKLQHRSVVSIKIYLIWTSGLGQNLAIPALLLYYSAKI